MTKTLDIAALSYKSEAYLVGIFWNEPNLYGLYPDEKINRKTFLNPVWGFYFGLGRYMYEKKIVVFDDISTYKIIDELNLHGIYEKYGSYQTVSELMAETKSAKENIDGYYNDIKKYHLLKQFRELMGDQVITCKGRYDPQIMTREQIKIYWTDKINQVVMDDDNPFEEGYLLADLRSSIEKWDKLPNIGLPFYNSRQLTRLTTGWATGQVYVLGGFSGKGKTSFVIDKIVISCIENKEKLVIIANEQSLDEWKKMLLTTAMGVGTKEYINRQRLQEGNFTQEEKTKLENAVKWLEQQIDDDKLIVLVFMDNYNINNVKQVLTHYAHRGYSHVIIDTGKPGDDRGDMARWERFAEDFKALYKLAREDAGGLNLALWVNVQLADSAINQRFLNELALGDSKKIKNESSVLFLFRPVWEDEYAGGKYELTCYKYKWDEFAEKYIREEFTLDRYDDNNNKNIYYLFFTAKNRRGQSNDTGADVLVYRWIPALNVWIEVGFASNVMRDSSR